MTVSIWQDRGERAVDACDVVVVGAGIVGVATAARLAQEGLHVAILEARTVASGATGRNAGMVLTGLAEHYSRAVEAYGRERAREAWALTAENRERLIETAQRLGVPVERTGSLLLAVRQPEVETLQATAALLQEDGFRAVFEPTDPLGRGFLAGLHQPDDAVVDPVALTERLLEESGVPCHTNTEVYRLEKEGADVRVWARRRTVRAAAVVLAVNAYAPLLDRYFVGKITPTRGQVLSTAPLPKTVLEVPCYADYGYEYFRQLETGEFLLGGWRQHYKDQEKGYADEVTDQVQQGLEHFLARYFPDVREKVTHRWSGVMGFSPDGLPLIGSLPHLPQVYFAVGFTGHGLGWCFVAAERVTRLLLHGEQPGLLSARRLS